MHVLFISGELIANELVSLLQLEGHQVKLFIKEIALRDCCQGFVDVIDDWEAELAWVGKNGLIIFDDIGFGEKQDALRKQGYRVVGGSALGDRLEIDRVCFVESGEYLMCTFYTWLIMLFFVSKDLCMYCLFRAN